MPLPHSFLSLIAERARDAAVFADVRIESGRVVCDAKDSAEPAFYSVVEDAGRIWVALQTPARYLSQSIEADLMFTGDKIADLIHEEMMDLGYATVHAEASELPVEHFRSADKLYTFRSPVPTTQAQVTTNPADAAKAAAVVLLGYEAAFRELGDMTAGGDE